jgi:predicted RNA-binding Zn ribbon-like protein
VADSFAAPWPGIGIGGAIALDFANTFDWRLRASPIELLRSFPDLLRWAWSAKTIDLSGARALRAWAEEHPRAAARALTEAIEIREAIAAVFQAVARGERIPAAPLARLDTARRAAEDRRVLRPDGRVASWGWRDGAPGPERPAAVAALDAVRILTTSDRERVRECGDAECGWLFLDTSRNRSRRWCTMTGCGNRNKARSFYRRSAARRARGDEP